MSSPLPEQGDKFADILGEFGRIAIGDAPGGWLPYRLAGAAALPSARATATRRRPHADLFHVRHH
jgi:hypothetical protein